ncbi:MAG: Rrf2 family transcriptional regulator [Planctomycetales bacterium]|nr:Rrf2 family transcriptional regulator [Planctomycetales bacterium]MCA9168819.1 Rrf2 family transcriptional regulator [Planctomycetales bacterium]
MQLSAKTEYACIAVLELAAAYSSGEPLQVRKIAAAHQIPSGFLVQILLQLKSAGLVHSTRGAAGGYRLARAPREISVWDVIAVVEGEGRTSSIDSRSPAAQVLTHLWEKAAADSREFMTSITFDRLAEQVRGVAHDMYYI